MRTRVEAMGLALITGGSRGIGAATAVRLAEDGHDIAVGYRSDAAAAERVVSDVRGLGRRAEAFAADMADAGAAEGLVDSVEQALGAIDVLVLNAGINSPQETDVRRVEVADWDRFMAIHLRAPFVIARRAIGGMLERGFGRIVLVSSVAAYTGGIIGPHYAASKAGLHGLAHSLAQLGAPHGVTANVIAPALIETDMLPGDPEGQSELAARIPVGRLGRPDEVADLISAIVRNGFVTSQSILIDGGMRPS
jgi:3-oxoacyl-[acyl-carrier protein] reductase